VVQPFLRQPPATGFDCEANDPSDRNFLKGICFEGGDQMIQFILRRSSIPLMPLPNETKSGQRNARQDDRLDRKHYAVNGGCVRQNGLDVSKVNPEGHGTCALAGPFFSKLDEPRAIEFRDPRPA
jgi:hypothetical protein